MRISGAIVVAVWLVAAAASAQASDDPLEQASAHFDRGITFYNEGRYDAALAELARAYELAPAHQTLYNLARVHAALGHAVESARAYARYLEEAGDEIGARRRREAEAALEEQRARIGRLEVIVDADGATVSVDGVDVATAPLREPLELSAGMHNVEVRAPGREATRHAVSIAGQSTARLEVSLREEVVPRGTLRVESSLPEVTITIDDEPVGMTPLQSTLPLRAGQHRVTATRVGYRTETRAVQIDEGAEAEVRFELRREPGAAPDSLGRLRIELPDAPSLVRVDGETMMGVDLELPIGAHHVVIEVTDRRPYEGTVRVPAVQSIEIRPALSWTLEARRERLEGAELQRNVGLGMMLGGGAILLASLSVTIWNEAEISATDERIREINALTSPCTMEPMQCTALDREGMMLNERQPTQNAIRGVSITGLVLGALIAGPGLAVWLSAPDSEAIDAGARAALRLTPGGAAIDGAF